jgi:menaquinol-cytochrome c reductase iron-sulfur subunit
MTRRDLYRYGSIALGGLVKLAVAVPAVAFLVSPLRKRGTVAEDGEFTTLTSLSQLAVGKPRSFAIIRDRTDAWVKYPAEPVGSVWLVRQPEGSKPEVIAYTSECPHLGCAINLTADDKSFLCPCHTSAFDLEGKPQNQVPPRPMDRLKVELTTGPDPKVRVKFQKFRTLAEEKIPLA